MKTLKRTLASLLVVVMIMTAIPFAGIDWGSVIVAKASDLSEYGWVSIDNGFEYLFESDIGLLTIRGKGAMYDYDNTSWDETSHFSNNTEIKYVIIQDGATSIGSYLFCECTNLSSVSIPDSVTSIGDFAFSGCTSLEWITIPDNVTSIGSSAFSGCTGLTNITIPDSVRSIDYWAFSECTGLTSIKLSNCNIIMGFGVFRDCTSLASFSFPNGVTSIWDSAFSGCTGLTNITIPDGVKIIEGHAFSGCTGLTSITIPDSVEEICFGAFMSCRSLTRVNIKSVESWCNIKFTNSREIPGGYAVAEANPLVYAHNLYLNNKLVTDLVIPDGVTSISDYAFQNCDCLTSLKISDSVTSIGEGAFYSCGGLTEVYYAGTEEQWQNINIDLNKSCLKNATFHYNWVCEHDYKLLSYITKSDCSHEGLANYTCQICKKTKKDTVPINPDCHTLKHMTTSATCTNSGYEYDICTSCYQMFNYAVIPAKGHSWSEWIIDTPATCTSEGARHHICIACGDAREDEVIPAHGHSYKHMINSATCENDGTEYDICTECMDTKNIVILPKAGHDWSDWVFEPDATCTLDGLKYRICNNNDSEREEVVIKAEGHSYKDEVIAPTCEERGYTTHTCEKCGDVRIDTYVDAISHNFKWRTSVNPTTTSEGLMVKECTHCGLVADEMTIPELVPDYVTGLTLSSEKEAINIGETVTLTATVNPDTAKNKRIIWKSSEKDVATVTDGTVTALKPGVTVITAQTEDGGYKEYCLVRVIGIVPVADTQTVIDSENGLIYGLSVNATNIEDYIDVVDDKMIIESASSSIGTGTQINIIFDGKVIDTYETVIFGDTNGDSWYNGMDAMIVNCIANGMLTQDDVGEAAYMAADCNHDGAIDQLDVDILQQAGVLLSQVDQSKCEKELLETSSAYVEYLNLIDQKVNANDGNAEEPAVDDTSTYDIINQKTNAFAWLIDFIIKLFNYLELHFAIIR